MGSANTPEKNLQRELNERHITLVINNYTAALCTDLEAEIASERFDTVINDNMYTVMPGCNVSLLSFLLPAYRK